MTSLKRVARLAVVLGLLLALFSTAGLVSAEPAAQGPLPGPALPPVWQAAGCQSYLIGGSAGAQAVAVCLPPGVPQPAGLILYAHGYVAPVPTADIFSGPTGNPWDDINPVEIDAVSGLLPTVLGQGFAFATTTYSKKGYAIEAAEGDLLALVQAIDPTGLLPVVQTGASEGGIITAMMLEKHPATAGGPFVGGLALCGPVGGMPEQIEYLGDFAHGFDYLFPDVFVYNGQPFGVTDVPPDAWTLWDSVYTPAIAQAVGARPFDTGWLFTATGAPIPFVPDTYVPTSLQALRFTVVGTNDIQATAAAYNGGTQPYETSRRLKWFFRPIKRIRADQAEQFVADYYDTTGNLTVPMVSLHTLWDAQVPSWHETMYWEKVNAAGQAGNFEGWVLPKYGHCDFTSFELLFAFSRLQARLPGAVGLPAASATANPLPEGIMTLEAAQQALAAEEGEALRVLEAELPRGLAGVPEK